MTREEYSSTTRSKPKIYVFDYASDIECTRKHPQLHRANLLGLLNMSFGLYKIRNEVPEDGDRITRLGDEYENRYMAELERIQSMVCDVLLPRR